jgi:hypothetical protein
MRVKEPVRMLPTTMPTFFFAITVLQKKRAANAALRLGSPAY